MGGRLPGRQDGDSGRSDSFGRPLGKRNWGTDKKSEFWKSCLGSIFPNREDPKKDSQMGGDITIGLRTFFSGKAWLRAVWVVLVVLFLFCQPGLAQTDEEQCPATFSLELASFTSDFTTVEFNPPPPNLAPLAIPSASSYWPWPAPNWETPDKAIDGDILSFWASSFSDGNAWFRLDWPQPINIDRIYLTDGSNIRGHTVHSISTYNLASASWVKLPNSNFTYGPPYPSSVDFRCSPVRTNAIILRIGVGPANPHPNRAVTLTELEVYGSPVVEVLAVDPYPVALCLDKAGAGSVIVFRAVTTIAATVDFKVRTAGGQEFFLGSRATQEQGSEHVAKLSWWGRLPNGTATTPGTFQVVAAVAESRKEAPFDIHLLAGIGGKPESVSGIRNEALAL